MPSKLDQLQLQFRQRIDEEHKEILHTNSLASPSASGLPRLVTNGKSPRNNNNVTTITNESSWQFHETTSQTVHQKAVHQNSSVNMALKNSTSPRGQIITPGKANGNHSTLNAASKQSQPRIRLTSSSSTGSSSNGSTTIGNSGPRAHGTGLIGARHQNAQPSMKRTSPMSSAAKSSSLATSHKTTSAATSPGLSTSHKVGPVGHSRHPEALNSKENLGTKSMSPSSNGIKSKSSSTTPTANKLPPATKPPNSSASSRSRSAPLKTTAQNGSPSRGATSLSTVKTNRAATPTRTTAPKTTSPLQNKPVATKKQSGTPSRASPTAHDKSASSSLRNSQTPTATSKRSIAAEPNDPNLSRCHICGRNFAKDRIEKHASICQKTSSKKKKVFDSTKMRVKGTEAEVYLKKGTSSSKQDAKAKKTNWRTQHENFLAAIREAKRVQEHLAAGGKLSDLPPPPPTDNPDYVPCPYCGRKFNAGVAERHIPKCKNILSNKKMKK